MSEEQVKAAETEAAAAEQMEGSGEEISEEDLKGVAGGSVGQMKPYSGSVVAFYPILGT